MADQTTNIGRTSGEKLAVLLAVGAGAAAIAVVLRSKPAGARALGEPGADALTPKGAASSYKDSLKALCAGGAGAAGAAFLGPVGTSLGLAASPLCAPLVDGAVKAVPLVGKGIAIGAKYTAKGGAAGARGVAKGTAAGAKAVAKVTSGGARGVARGTAAGAKGVARGVSGGAKLVGKGATGAVKLGRKAVSTLTFGLLGIEDADLLAYGIDARRARRSGRANPYGGLAVGTRHARLAARGCGCETRRPRAGGACAC